MNETAEGKSVCPVCEEELDGATPKCFRCTTQLTNWWPLEEALRGQQPASIPVAETGNQTGTPNYLRWAVLLVAAGLLGFAGGSLWQREPDRSTADRVVPPIASSSPSPPEVPAPPTSEPVPDAPRFVRYSVQPGDSLWRVAASLTGDGQNWRRLWPEYEGLETRLQRGADLEIPITALRESVQSATPEEP